MRVKEIPAEEWFIHKPEALDYLKKVASEIRIVTSNDRMIAELRDKLRERHVVNVAVWPARVGFHFEMDRGRPHKGHLYGVASRYDRSELMRIGSEKSAEMSCTVDSVSGQHLLDAIREIFVDDILQL